MDDSDPTGTQGKMDTNFNATPHDDEGIHNGFGVEEWTYDVHGPAVDGENFVLYNLFQKAIKSQFFSFPKIKEKTL